MSERKLAEGYYRGTFNGPSGSYPIILRVNGRGWWYPKSAPAKCFTPDVPCGGDTGKCPVVKPDEGPPRKFADGRKVVVKAKPDKPHTIRSGWYTANSNSWWYRLENEEYGFGWYGQTANHRQIHDTLPNKMFEYITAECHLALPPKYPVGTWRTTRFGPAPISDIAYRESAQTWAYTCNSRDGMDCSTVMESEVVVCPPDPSYRWPKVGSVQCVPAPETTVRVVDHPANAAGCALSEHNPDASRAGETLRVRRVIALGPSQFEVQTETGPRAWLHNCVPAGGEK